eukprot:CAMPEP_0173208178 /NCGR_PEP_ID=MMETSP1141-20130122/22358_1 /TAXON_ID=483371 /ORGANISM="non described non described, Strain CCMP2298" /LENGTH=30 /DNA_ID= /DNA_START= /DNA_END= /DNA_ORIENTATION=
MSITSSVEARTRSSTSATSALNFLPTVRTT